jgi:membrane protein DedA with SNARE-associated domain
LEAFWLIIRDGTLIVMTFGYGGILVAMLIEGSGIPLPFPGAMLLAFVGYTVWTGHLSLSQAILVAAAGSTIGAYVLYRIARDAGTHLLERYGKRLALTPEKLTRADSWFHTHAGRAMFFARMTPGLRVYISVAAGLARMNQVVFLLATFAGTALWASLLIGLGWVLGKSWNKVVEALNVLQLSLLVVAIFVILGLLLGWRRNESNLKS